MSALIVVTLKLLVCATVVTDEDTSFERVLQVAENADYVTLEAYRTKLPVGTHVVTGTGYVVEGDVYMCTPR